MKILIAEEGPLVRHMLTEFLANSGYDAIAAENGRVAWERYAASPAPVVIADLGMPLLDGPGLCRKIKEAALLPRTYVILCSGQSIDKLAEAAAECGADEILQNPFTPPELQALLDKAAQELDKAGHGE